MRLNTLFNHLVYGAISIILTSSAILFTPTAWADNSLENSVSLVGDQQMLIHRIVKAYAQAGLEIKQDQAVQQISTASARFDKQLDQLIKTSPNPETTVQLNKVETLWQPFRSTASCFFR